MKSVDKMYVEIAGCNIVEAVLSVVENLSVEAGEKTEVANFQVMEDTEGPKVTTEGPKVTTEVLSETEFEEKIKLAYPKAEEELMDFLNRCKLKNYEIMLCPKCSFVFHKEATKVLEHYKLQSQKRGK